MELIYIIIFGIIFIIMLYIRIETSCCNRKINDYFKSGNVIVYGAKGKGKDLLFQKHIIMNKKKKYMSNITYGYVNEIVPIKELSVEPNTYKNFIEGEIVQIDKKNDREGIDYYLSDAGVYLPCQMDFELHRKYPSLPIYYALSRHLYDSNIHVNCQALGRVWKAIREQGDKYIKCKGKINLPFILICKITFYDKYESAYNNLLPIKSRMLNGYSKAQVDQYNATNGEIKDMFYIIRKRDIKYDTRHFEKVIFKADSIQRATKIQKDQEETITIAN